MIRRAKTVDDSNLSCNSQTKRRMSRQQAKKYKMEKLRLKFNNVVNQLNSLKEETTQDHQELNNLIIRSQRIERLALQSHEKAKRICAESLDVKRKLSFPLTVEKQGISMFNPDKEVITDDNRIFNSNKHQETMAVICEDQPENIQYIEMRQDVNISEKEESKMTATNQVRASQENVFGTNVPSEVKEESRLSSNCFSQLSSQKMSVKNGSGIASRKNRFEQQWRKSSVSVQVPSKTEEKVNKNPSIAPLIWAIILSIVFLWLLSL